MQPSDMRLNDGTKLRVGLWLGNETTPPFRIVWFDDKVVVVDCGNNCLTMLWHGHLACLRVSTPAELDRAGIADEQRLLCQRSVWSGVTFKSSQVLNHADCYVDGGYAFDVSPYGVEISVPAKWRDSINSGVEYGFRDRDDIAQAVLSHRRAREGKLKWNGCYVFRRNIDGTIQFFNSRRGKWENPTQRWRDGDFYGSEDATPAQLASSGMPIEDVPAGMRGEVERLRDTKTLACGLTVRVGDLIRPVDSPTAYRVDDLFSEWGPKIVKLSEWLNNQWREGRHAASPKWRHLTPAEIASTTIPLDDIADAELRKQVAFLRKPTTLREATAKPRHEYIHPVFTEFVEAFYNWRQNPSEILFHRVCVTNYDAREYCIQNGVNFDAASSKPAVNGATYRKASK